VRIRWGAGGRIGTDMSGWVGGLYFEEKMTKRESITSDWETWRMGMGLQMDGKKGWMA
jgi:hypothetical protein